MRPFDPRDYCRLRRPANDGVFVLARGRLDPAQPCLSCHVCKADLLHGEFTPWPPAALLTVAGVSIALYRESSMPITCCWNCYWEVREKAHALESLSKDYDRRVAKSYLN